MRVARLSDHSTVDVQMARGRSTNQSSQQSRQVAFLEIPNSPVEPISGKAMVSGGEGLVSGVLCPQPNQFPGEARRDRLAADRQSRQGSVRGFRFRPTWISRQGRTASSHRIGYCG